MPSFNSAWLAKRGPRQFSSPGITGDEAARPEASVEPQGLLLA